MAHITIGTTTTIVSYTATASQTAFTIPFEFFNETDLKVYQNGTLKTLTTHYTITPVTTYTGGFKGGTMTLGTGATVNDVIVIELDISPSRDTDFPTTGGFNIDTLNTWIDKVIVIFKQAFENIGRKVGRASTDTSTYSLDLPTGVTSTAKTLMVDSSNGLTLGVSTTTITDASTQATAAATSATASANSATASASSASSASSSATASAASAALIAQGTASTTSLAIATGSKAFTITAGLGFNVGDFVLCTSNADTTNFMHGQIASYSGTTLTVTVASIGGSGTKNDWKIRISGLQGNTGATGSTGAQGGVGPVGVGLAIALS